MLPLIVGGVAVALDRIVRLESLAQTGPKKYRNNPLFSLSPFFCAASSDIYKENRHKGSAVTTKVHKLSITANSNVLLLR